MENLKTREKIEDKESCKSKEEANKMLIKTILILITKIRVHFWSYKMQDRN